MNVSSAGRDIKERVKRRITCGLIHRVHSSSDSETTRESVTAAAGRERVSVCTQEKWISYHTHTH